MTSSRSWSQGHSSEKSARRKSSVWHIVIEGRRQISPLLSPMPSCRCGSHSPRSGSLKTAEIRQSISREDIATMSRQSSSFAVSNADRFIPGTIFPALRWFCLLLSSLIPPNYNGPYGVFMRFSFNYCPFHGIGSTGLLRPMLGQYKFLLR